MLPASVSYPSLSKLLLKLMTSFNLTQKLSWKWPGKTRDKLIFQIAVFPYSQWQTQAHKRGIQPWYILFAQKHIKRTGGKNLLQMDKNIHRCNTSGSFPEIFTRFNDKRIGVPFPTAVRIRYWSHWYDQVVWLNLVGARRRAHMQLTAFAVIWIRAQLSHLPSIFGKIFGYILNWAKK